MFNCANCKMTLHVTFFSPCLFFLDPSFVHVHLIPDSNEKNDDKLYFFFREKSSEMGQSPKSQSRIGRICLVSWNLWPKIWLDEYDPKFETFRTIQHFWKRFQLQPRACELWFVDTWLWHLCLLAADVPKSTHIWPPCLQYVSLSMWPLNLWPFDLSGQPFWVWQSFFTRACYGKDG